MDNEIMQKQLLADLHISRLTLGTVQFGIPYGVANKTGMPDYEDVKEIISAAYEHGITCLDTAAAYGTSEETIGRVLADLNIKDKVTVVTKAAHIDIDTPPVEVKKAFEETITRSITRLGIDPLPLVLIHDETNIPLLEYMEPLKQKGLVKHIGASVQYTSWAKKAIDSECVEAIQWPGNMLDMRYEREGLYDLAADKCAVFLRSVYLQGLLVMSDAETPNHLKEIIPIRTKLNEIAHQAGIDIQEMAMRYALSLAGCASILVGVESVSQVISNIKVMDKGPLPSDVLQIVRDTVPDITEDIILPVNWAARAAREAKSSNS
jgi:aryl-alcohol dehydrogenase-like predicted oxidoreductase